MFFIDEWRVGKVCHLSLQTLMAYNELKEKEAQRLRMKIEAMEVEETAI